MDPFRHFLQRKERMLSTSCTIIFSVVVVVLQICDAFNHAAVLKRHGTVLDCVLIRETRARGCLVKTYVNVLPFDIESF